MELLPGEPAELVRQDSHFKKLELDIGNYQSPAEVVQLLLQHPKLMQRPVAVRGDKAIIARPYREIMQLL
ncbi:MAG: hypothetical protein OXE93_09495 [bacterium]|nr:hypothetical protein [bacterium]MCY4258065.1 hypothetical protein [bacterium]